MEWNTRVLQDLIYERVRDHVDLVSLAELERDLADSIEQALGSGGGATSDARGLGKALLDEAWRRVERDWREMREADCALCVEASRYSVRDA